ncbi:MAG TPA: hypothetical protein VLX68_05265 [Chitinivibrionales bacterium]|nr:hypothetical protein [Chitinivibrionales bacterium]
MKPKKLLLVLLACFAAGLASCGGQVLKRIHTSPEEYLLNDLRSRRILMFGDFGHGQPLPYYSLVQLLNKWVSLAAKDADVDRKIVLVLERDSAQIALIKDFIRTNDPKPLFQSTVLAPHGTMEGMEFLCDLRRIAVRTDSLNAHAPLQKQITLELFGPETTPEYGRDLPDYKLTIAQSDFFFHARDSLLARAITGHLANRADAKAVIFYGNGHLIKNFTDKNIYHLRYATNTMGYFLAYYLKKAYGDAQVLSVNQVPFDPRAHPLKPPAAKKVGTGDFFIEGAPLRAMRLPADRYDGNVARTKPAVYAHILSAVHSRMVLDACIARMDSACRDTTGALWKEYLAAIRSLRYLCGKDFGMPADPEPWFKSSQPALVLQQWKEWVGANGGTIAGRLDTREFREEMEKMYFNGFSSPNVRAEMISIGFDRAIWDSSGFSETRWNEKVWPEAIDRIKIINAIGQLWFGDSLEQSNARGFLVQTTGQDFSEPDLYLKWFRSRKEGVAY